MTSSLRATCAKVRFILQLILACTFTSSMSFGQELPGDFVTKNTMDGNIETEGTVRFGPNAVWKGRSLHSRSLDIEDGATLIGEVIVPWSRSEDID